LQTLVATKSFVGTNETISYRTNLIATGLSQPGGDGNPGSAAGHYGWNVRIVHQTDTWAEVVIWNSFHDTLDADGDGMPNWQEAIAGTAPNDPKSLLRITNAASDSADHSFLIEWPGVANRTYRVLRTDSLQTPFTPVATHLPGTPPKNSFRDNGPEPASVAYYRIEVD
jgi:hypothetical protein